MYVHAYVHIIYKFKTQIFCKRPHIRTYVYTYISVYTCINIIPAYKRAWRSLSLSCLLLAIFVVVVWVVFDNRSESIQKAWLCLITHKLLYIHNKVFVYYICTSVCTYYWNIYVQMEMRIHTRVHWCTYINK